jgi:hypothetical protein
LGSTGRQAVVVQKWDGATKNNTRRVVSLTLSSNVINMCTISANDLRNLHLARRRYIILLSMVLRKTSINVFFCNGRVVFCSMQELNFLHYLYEFPTAKG